jgi:hypothetical protein
MAEMTTLTVEIPQFRSQCLRWVTDQVLSDWLGLDVASSTSIDGKVAIALGGKILSIESRFPDLSADRAFWQSQMPVEPLVTADLTVLGLPELAHLAPLPILYGAPSLTIAPDRIDCSIDIFGSIFFMLSRFEEIVRPERDVHDRFPATASLAMRENFLFRPIVDDYVDLLWALMQRLWPGLERPKPDGQIRVSCDVDQPFDRVKSNPLALVRSVGGDLVRRKSLSTAGRRVANFVARPFGIHHFDPYYTFDWYMDVCEEAGLRAAFYFIADHSAGTIDGDYDIFDPRILALMRDIDRRGHEIGMHASYNTFRDPEQMLRERRRLRDAARSAGLDIEVAGNRQHYLRWDSATTPDNLDAAGFTYDTTGSFADSAGFRYGTSRSFPMWSWQYLAPLRLRQKPLVLMECSVIAAKYMNFGYSQQAINTMLEIKESSLTRGGNFTFLWHNSHLSKKEDRQFFKALTEKTE